VLFAYLTLVRENKKKRKMRKKKYRREKKKKAKAGGRFEEHILTYDMNHHFYSQRVGL